MSAPRRRERWGLLRLGLLLSVILSVPGAAASEPLGRADVLDRVRQAYAAPWAERVTIEIESAADGGWTTRERSDIRAHFDPARGLLLDFGEVCTHVHEGRLAVWRAEGSPVFRETADPSSPLRLLAHRLPPIWLPQGAAAFGDPLSRLPILGRPGAPIDWAGHARTAAEGIALLRGSIEGGEVELESDAESGRIVRFTVGIDSASTPWRVVLTSERMEPDPEAFDTVPGEDAETVTTLAGLAAGAKLVSPGERVPDLGLVDGAGRPWDLLDRFERDIALATAARSEIPPVLVVLLLFEAAGDEDATDLAEPEFLKVRRLAGDLRTELAIRLAPRQRGPELIVRAAAVFDLGGYALSRYEALDTSWRDASVRRPLLQQAERGSLLWSTTPDATIRRFSRSEACVLVVIGPDRRLIWTGPPAGIDGADLAARVLRRGDAPAQPE